MSYGLTSLPLFGQVGAVYFNFLLWGISIFQAWLVLKPFGAQTTPVDIEDPTTTKILSTDTHSSKEKVREVIEN